MDPLSLIANLIAVAGVARTTARYLKSICDLHHVPRQLFDLSDEVNDLEIILKSLENLLSCGHTQPRDVVFEQYLRDLFNNALKRTQTINQIVGSKAFQNIKYMDLTSRKKLWKMWAKQKHIENMCMDLRSIRQEISTAMTVLTASEVPHVRSSLRNIILSHQSMDFGLCRIEQSTSIKLEQLTTEIAATRPHFERLQTSIQQLATTVHEKSLSTSAPLRPALKISRRSSVKDFCDALCICHCHRPVMLKSPLWMQSLIGVVFVTYFNIFKKYPCTEKKCRGNEKSYFEVDFCFPKWFIGRILKLRDQWTFSGHMITIRTPRVVELDSSSFMLAQFGNVEGLQTVFSDGMASPFDVDMTGTSTLMTAVASKQVDMCRFLLQQFADPTQLDTLCRSAISQMWEHILRDPLDSTHQEIKALFDPYIDMEEDLKAKKLTALHQTVLGLTSVDLTMQLQLSTTQIDSRCSIGKTPLCWALDISNLAAAKTLIDFGARLDIPNVNGVSVVHYAAMSPKIETLELIIAAVYSSKDLCPEHRSITINGYDKTLIELASCTNDGCNITSFLDQQNIFGRTAVDYAVAYYRFDHLALLLSHGAATEIFECSSPTMRFSIPLMIAVQYSAHEILELLLQNGARRDIKNHDNRGILHSTAKCGDLKTIEILHDAELCCIGVDDKDKFGYTPLQVFDNVRFTQTPEDEDTRSKCREAFLRLLESVVPADSVHLCMVSGYPELRGSVSGLSDLLDDEGSDSSDEDEFFDARSTFDESID